MAMNDAAMSAVNDRLKSALRGAAVAALAVSTASYAAAQSHSNYPTRPVSLLVPYGAGGVADVGMRILGDKLSDRLKQQFVIENRPGAAGIVAAQSGGAATAGRLA